MSSRSSDEEEDGDIRCVCGNNIDKGLMIACERCDKWQHAPCVGYTSQRDIPDKFYCERCRRPEDNMTSDSTKGKKLFSHLTSPLKEEMELDKEGRDLSDLDSILSNCSEDEREWARNRLDLAATPGDIDTFILEKYALRFARRIDQRKGVLRGVGQILGESLPDIARIFRQIGSEIQRISAYAEGAVRNTGPQTPAEMMTGWKEISGLRWCLDGESQAPLQPVSSACLLDVSPCKSSDGKRDEWKLVATQKVNKGEMVSAVSGVVRRATTVFAEARKQNNWILNHDLPCCAFATWNDGDSSMLYCIDGRKEGSVTRFARKSCNPSVEVRFTDSRTKGKRPSAHLCAVRPLKAGDEVTIPFPHLGENLRSTEACCCEEEQECVTRDWYLERMKYSNVLLHIGPSGELQQPFPALNSPNVDTPSPSGKRRMATTLLKTDLNPIQTPRGKLSREERKLQAVLERIQRMEHQEEKKKMKQSGDSSPTKKVRQDVMTPMNRKRSRLDASGNGHSDTQKSTKKGKDHSGKPSHRDPINKSRCSSNSGSDREAEAEELKQSQPAVSRRRRRQSLRERCISLSDSTSGLLVNGNLPSCELPPAPYPYMPPSPGTLPVYQYGKKGFLRMFEQQRDGGSTFMPPRKSRHITVCDQSRAELHNRKPVWKDESEYSGKSDTDINSSLNTPCEEKFIVVKKEHVAGVRTDISAPKGVRDSSFTREAVESTSVHGPAECGDTLPPQASKPCNGNGHGRDPELLATSRKEDKGEEFALPKKADPISATSELADSNVMEID